jgi:hypothetical protein
MLGQPAQGAIIGAEEIPLPFGLPGEMFPLRSGLYLLLRRRVHVATLLIRESTTAKKTRRLIGEVDGIPLTLLEFRLKDCRLNA